MDYLQQPGTHYHNHADITQRLRACAGQIISHALEVEHVPQGARDIMANPLVHDFVRAAFRDIVVGCLAEYFYELEKRRKDVLDEVVRRTRSEYGTWLHLVQSAIKKMKKKESHYDVLSELEKRVTPEVYGAFVAVVRQEYARI